MATGALPFHGNTAPELTDAILHHTPVPPVRLQPGVPPELERIVLRLIEKDPALRYQTASDLRAGLKRPKRDTEPGQKPAQVLKRTRFAAAALAAAIPVAAFFALRPKSAPPHQIRPQQRRPR
jgi:eukaryotic-like serine/threonine-protein kinase